MSKDIQFFFKYPAGQSIGMDEAPAAGFKQLILNIAKNTGTLTRPDQDMTPPPQPERIQSENVRLNKLSAAKISCTHVCIKQGDNFRISSHGLLTFHEVAGSPS